MRALEADLCAAGMTIRATTPDEANRTVSRWGGDVGVQAAVNANMWHCGALCGVGIGNGTAFDASDDTHWGYLAFTLDGVDYPWDYDAIPPPAGTEQAVGGHPRIVHDGAPVPAFAGNCLERHPRTAAGLSADRRRLVLAVVDGRSSSSVGMTCAELAALMTSLGAHQAINLDGGGSSTMWLSDRGVVNVPSDGTQRVVRNHLGVLGHGEGAPRYCVGHRPLAPEVGAVLRPLDQPTSEAWGFTLHDLRLVSAERIAAYPEGPPVEAPRLVRATGEPAIYLIDGGTRRHVINPNSLRAWHLHDDPVEELDAAALAAIPEGAALTELPYIAVSPAPHVAFLVDHAPPPPPMPELDAGGAGVDAGDAGAPDRDASEARDAGVNDPGPSPDTLRGECAVHPGHGSRTPWALVAGCLAALWSSRRRGRS